jgi:signal transduction histidine kinase
MARSPSVPSSPLARGQDEASASTVAPRLWGDPLLRTAFLTAGLLLAYQLTVTLLQPAWIGPVTNWLQMLVAWSGLVVVVLVSLWFTRTAPRESRSLWCLSVALLFYAVARTLWLVKNQVVFPHQIPEPSWLDLFFALQYPCFLLALLLAPRVRPGIHQTLVWLDACLLLAAAVALSWYFLLAPIYLSSHETLAAKLVNLSYPVGDLALFFGLTMIWLHYREYATDHAVMALLIPAILCLMVGDTWFAINLMNTSRYQTGGPPDLFWLAFYLLLPLAMLVQFRLLQRRLAGVDTRSVIQQPYNLQWQDFIASLRVISPVAAALFASAVLFILRDLGTSMLPPLRLDLIALFLLGLALVRQAMTAVDNQRLHREQEAALRQSTAQMETFLGIAGHELKNPLASAQLALQLVELRIRRLLERERVEVADVAPLLEPVVRAENQEERLHRLVNDLVGVARVQAGKLDLHLAPADLATIVREEVEGQRQLRPERTIVLESRAEQCVPVMADAQRIGQVVTNYLTNGLKYSPADCPVTVGLQVDDQQAQLWVRDLGPGLPPEEQEHIWERYYRVKGIEVQSGSGVELGLGLHICRTIIELHHGQVGVQSARGAGSTFWFSLPLAAPEPVLEESEAGAPKG